MSVASPQSWITACAAVVALTQLPSFRVGVDVVSLTVTVSDPSGRYVTDLAPEQMTVFEDGAKQDVTYFSRTNLPIALALLLDTSASMEDRMATAQEAAIGFARRLRPQDLGELIDFDREVQVLQGFTSDPAALEHAIRATTAGGSTSLYNAVYISLKELKKNRAKTEQDVRRQAIVVVSDGEDTSSLVTFDEVLDLAKRSETAIYAIGLRPREEIASKSFKEADFVLRQLARETGGRVFFPARIEELAGVYAQIADELASQYAIGYISKNSKRDGAWRRIAVRVDREGATTRTRQGYFGPSGK
jgi:Ca-activated chloride channel family protein